MGQCMILCRVVRRMNCILGDRVGLSLPLHQNGLKNIDMFYCDAFALACIGAKSYMYMKNI